MARSSRYALFACGLAVCVLGCEQNDAPERLPVVKASGELFFNQKPATGAKVMLHPITTAATQPKLFPKGTVDDAGRYALTTYVQDDGAPAGDYHVTVTWPDTSFVPKTPLEKEEVLMGGERPDKLRGRYAVPETSGLRVTISSEPNQRLERIDLR